LQPLHFVYLKISWVPTQSGQHTLTATIVGDSPNNTISTTQVVNALPVVNTGPDFTVDVKTSAHFDGSNSSDPDGFIENFTWQVFDEVGGSMTGPTPNYTFNHAGQYRVQLTVYDSNNASSTAQMLVTVHETRPDLLVDSLVAS